MTDIEPAEIACKQRKAKQREQQTEYHGPQGHRGLRLIRLWSEIVGHAHLTGSGCERYERRLTLTSVCRPIAASCRWMLRTRGLPGCCEWALRAPNERADAGARDYWLISIMWSTACWMTSSGMSGRPPLAGIIPAVPVNPCSACVYSTAFPFAIRGAHAS